MGALSLQEQISGVRGDTGTTISDNAIVAADNGFMDPMSGYTMDASVDVPGRPQQQSLFGWMFGYGQPDENQRDASQTPETPRPVSRDTGAEGPGILSRMWTAMAHPLQTVEDTGASTGSAIGKGVANAMTPIMNSIMPLVIVMAVVVMGSLFIVARSGAVRVRV